MKIVLFMLSLVLLGSLAMAQGSAPWTKFTTEKADAYQCMRADHPIAMDGTLNDPAWAKAPEITDFIIPPKMDYVKFGMTEPKPAISLTHAKIMWDDKYIYFGAVMEDKDLYCVTPAGHNHPFGTDDIIELFVKPSDDLPYYWELHIVPSGGTRSYYYARRGAGGESRSLTAKNPGMEAKVTLHGTLNSYKDVDKDWVVTMRMPWTAFKSTGGKPKVGDFWKFLVSRYDYSVYLEEGCELSAAAPLPWQNYHLFEYYPYLTFVEK